MRKLFREAAFEVMWEKIEKSTDVKEVVEELILGSFTEGYFEGVLTSVGGITAFALAKWLLKKLVKK